MLNAFSTEDRMPIPKNADACVATDDTARELWKIAKLLETWGAIVRTVIIILGVLFSVVLTVATSKFIESISGESNFGVSIGIFLFIAVISAIVAFIIYLLYHLISLAIRSLASIVQNTRVSANLALYQAAKDTDNFECSHPAYSVPAYSIPTHSIPDMWQCRNCGTQNKPEHGQCKKCGKFRS